MWGDPDSKPLILPPNAVHIWWFRGDQAPVAELLDASERSAMGRLRSEADRLRFAARRTNLRRVLAAYGAGQPAELRIERWCERCGDPHHGRPRLWSPATVSFSTASRPGAALIAVSTPSMRVGVDLERADLSAAAAVFDGALGSLEHACVDPSDPMGVVRLWCRKEALLKADGVGLAVVSLTGIDVRNELVQGWHLADLPLHGDWVGAIATRSTAAPTIVIDGDVALHS